MIKLINERKRNFGQNIKTINRKTLVNIYHGCSFHLLSVQYSVLFLQKKKKSNRMTNNIFDLHPIIEEHL
jgi:hypothetical protein